MHLAELASVKSIGAQRVVTKTRLSGFACSAAGHQFLMGGNGFLSKNILSALRIF